MTPSTVSYSRLSTYLECPELYRLRYVVKPKGFESPLQEPLIKGSLAHGCIEEYLKEGEKQVAVEIALADWVVNVCKMPIQTEKVELENEVERTIYDEWVEDDDEKEAEHKPEGLGIDMDLLTDFAIRCGHLLHRCSASYNGEDKIRNRDGSVPKNPLDHPPSEFKKEYYAQRLNEPHLELDNQATRCNMSFKRMSFSNIAAWGVCYVYNFELPEAISKVDAIEMPLADKPVLFGPKKDRYWNGLIDTIYSTEDGAVIINDHKTEKDRRRPEDVAFDLQLNSYAAVRYEQTDTVPDYIAITHLATNSFIVAHTDTDVMALSMDYLEQIQGDIDDDMDNKGPHKEWFKKWPSKYGSPCIRRWDGVITQVCPYIRKCWKGYADCIEDELVEYLGY